MKTDELVRLALQEDLPSGEDVTTDFLLPNPHLKSKAHLIAKEDLVLSGRIPFEKCFRHFEQDLKLQWFFEDGALVLNGQTVAIISAELQTLLKAERTALNFLGHLSGVATLTRCFVEAVSETSQSCAVVDTRKTLPMMRELQKQAVVHGGGKNHRMHLGHEILIKENHRRGSSHLIEDLQKVAKQRADLRITVECVNIAEVKEACSWPIHCILLDNMSLTEMKEATEIIPAHIESEASGNMTLSRVKEVAATGVQRISIGALTHSAPTADLSLLIQ